MGNARSASYSYCEHQATHEQEQWQLLAAAAEESSSSMVYHYQSYWQHHQHEMDLFPADINQSDDFKSAQSDQGVTEMTMTAGAVAVAVAASASTPPPLPFVRHRNVAIRLPRTSLNQLQRCRALSLSCSLTDAVSTSPPSADDADDAERQLTTGHEETLIQCRDAIDRLSSMARHQSSAATEDEDDQEDEEEDVDQIVIQRGNSPAPFRRHQFLSLRSYPNNSDVQRRRHQRTLSVRIRRSNSISNEMTRAYLDAARLKKLLVQQNLTTNRRQSEEADDINSLSDSNLTMQTANTSMSSGYGHHHAMAAALPPLHHPPPDYDYVEASGEPEPLGGSASGLFYVDWLRQQLGTVPPYVELRHGRLHLKLVKGQ